MRVLIVLILLAGPVIGQTATGYRITDLRFMAGCWAIDRPDLESRIEEQWTAPAGGTMIGMSRSVRSGKTTGWEFMRIEAGEEGLVFVSRPKGNNEDTYFKLKSLKSGTAVFENLGHDFPQRVIYRYEKGDALAARIEGTQNGILNGIDFPYKRTKCV